MTPNVPAKTDDTGGLVLAEEWDAIRAEFDDGSTTFKEHFGLSVPRLKTDFGRNGRGWIDDLSGEAFTELEFVILAYPPSRAFWIKTIDEGGGGVPDCRSHDMVMPESSSPAPQAQFCAACPHAQWTENKDGDRQRPRCAESINVVAFDVADAGRFVWLRFAGTGIRPFKEWVSYLASKRMQPFMVTTKATLEKQKDGSLEWLTPRFSMGRALTPDEVRPMRDVAKAAMQAYEQVADEMAKDEAKGAVIDEEPFE